MHTLRVLNELDPTKFEVLVVCPNKVGEYEDNLTDNVKLVKVGSSFIYEKSSTLGRFSTYWGLKKYIRSFQPDVIFSVQDIHNAILLRAVRGMKNAPKIIIGVQNSVQDCYGDTTNRVNRWVMSEIRTHYHEADLLIALSKGVEDGLGEVNPQLKGKMKVIYNCGLDDLLLKRLQEVGDHPVERSDKVTLVSVGRLNHQKGYPILFQALKEVKNAGYDFEQWILGKGDLEAALKEQVRELGLEDNVKFLGFQSNPFQFMATADIFILSSLFEGFGNVIVEAMACGTPVISTDCPHGPSEIIKHEESGILVEVNNSKSLASGIMKLCNDLALRNKLQEKGRVRANDFHSKIIAKEYADTFLEIGGHR